MAEFNPKQYEDNITDVILKLEDKLPQTIVVLISAMDLEVYIELEDYNQLCKNRFVCELVRS
jgi:hypothetical protein